MVSSTTFQFPQEQNFFGSNWLWDPLRLLLTREIIPFLQEVDLKHPYGTEVINAWNYTAIFP
jgi:hypothetical protein